MNSFKELLIRLLVGQNLKVMSNFGALPMELAKFLLPPGGKVLLINTYFMPKDEPAKHSTDNI